MLRLSIIFFTALCLATVSVAKQPLNGINATAPIELNHWSKLIGQWRTSEESLKSDGSGWEEATGADWHFYWAMNGWAVRDEYFSPPLDQEAKAPTGRQIGTNLRVYNKEQQQWLMAWVTKAGKTVDLYTAESDEKYIVMLSKGKTPNGAFARITFFDIKDDSFEWKVEWSKDGKNNWMEVHRIHGTRVSH